MFLLALSFPSTGQTCLPGCPPTPIVFPPPLAPQASVHHFSSKGSHCLTWLFVHSSVVCPRLLHQPLIGASSAADSRGTDQPGPPGAEGEAQTRCPLVQSSEACWHFPLWLRPCDRNQLLALAEVIRKLKPGPPGGPQDGPEHMGHHLMFCECCV